VPVALPWRRSGLLLALGVLLLVVGLPLAELAAAALGEGWGPARQAFAGAEATRAALNTLWTATLAALLAVAGGTAGALVTERTRPPAPRALRFAMLLPLIVPGFVAAMSWARAYGPGGLLDDLLGAAVPGTFGAPGVVAVITVNAVPLAYLVVAAGLASRSEPDMERAARASGATAWQAFRTVTLPLLRPALAAAAGLAFVVGVNAFGVPAVLGLPAGFVTVTTRIYRDLAFAADPMAFARVLVLSAGLVLIALAAVAAVDAAGGWGGRAIRTGAPAGGGATPSRRWSPGLALWVYLVLTSGVPLLALTLTALTRAVGLPPVPANWTLANFAEALSGRTLPALGNTLVLAVTAATAAVLLGGLVASLRRRSLATMAALTFAVPGSALAVAALLAYGPWLRDTLTLILVAYLAKFWALGHRPIAGAADRLPPDLIRAARVSGAAPATALRTITLPLLRPVLAGAWLAVFLFATHELTMSALLYGPGSETLAVVILNLQQLGDVTVTSALALLLTLAVLVLVWPLAALLRGRASGVGAA
jgi:iron(III) transport system permease protein